MSTFPALLKRTRFATHDPSITRIYTTTPSSLSTTGDWGLKYPIRRPAGSGPRYIRFTQLDAGQFIGSDWRPAEHEARFVRTWGSGRIGWTSEEDMPRMQTQRAGFYGIGLGEDALAEPEREEEREARRQYMEDVSSMSEKEFRDYLRKVRSHRREFLAGKLERLGDGAAAARLPEDNTLVGVAAQGHVGPGDAASYQVRLATKALDDPKGDSIQSRPHRLGGLTYSRATGYEGRYDSTSHLPGRLLERVENERTRYSSRFASGGQRAGTNLPWVAGVGGVLATTKRGGERISDVRSEEEPVDFTRASKDRGTSKFRVVTAEVKSLPKVLDLAKMPKLRRRHNDEVGRRNRDGPLDTFKFDIQVENLGKSQGGGDEVEVGTREWVGYEPQVSYVPSIGDSLSGPKSQRQRGEARRMLGEVEREEREQQAKSINALLERLKMNSARP